MFNYAIVEIKNGPIGFVFFCICIYCIQTL